MCPFPLKYSIHDLWTFPLINIFSIISFGATFCSCDTVENNFLTKCFHSSSTQTGTDRGLCLHSDENCSAGCQVLVGEPGRSKLRAAPLPGTDRRSWDCEARRQLAGESIFWCVTHRGHACTKRALTHRPEEKTASFRCNVSLFIIHCRCC